jgi:hypothetical protein
VAGGIGGGGASGGAHPLQSLDLRSNNVGVAGAKALAAALAAAAQSGPRAGLAALNLAANFLKAEVVPMPAYASRCPLLQLAASRPPAAFYCFCDVVCATSRQLPCMCAVATARVLSPDTSDPPRPLCRPLFELCVWCGSLFVFAIRCLLFAVFLFAIRCLLFAIWYVVCIAVRVFVCACLRMRAR